MPRWGPKAEGYKPTTQPKSWGTKVSLWLFLHLYTYKTVISIKTIMQKPRLRRPA